MKLFLVLAFVAMAAAAPEPTKLAEAQVDPVKFVDTVQEPAIEEIQADGIKIAEAPALPEVSPVDAVKFVDFAAPQDTPVVDAVKIAESPAEVAEAEEKFDAVRFVDFAPEDTPAVEAEDAPVDAVKIAESPAEIADVEEKVDAVRFVDYAPEDTPVNAVKIAESPAEIAEAEPKVDAVRIVDAPLPEADEASPVKLAYTPFELARDAQESFDAVFVHAPLVQFVAVQDLPAPIQLQAAALPVIKDTEFDAVRFVDSPQVAVPLEEQPTLPINAGMIAVPPQIMDVMRVAEQILGAQQQPIFVVDPMLR